MSTQQLVEEISSWYRANAEDKSYLLPQNLSSELLQNLTEVAEEVIKSSEPEKMAELWNPFITIVGLLMAQEDKTFKESPEAIGIKARTYAINMTIETMRRANIIAFQHDFSLENVLDLSFERGFTLSSLSQKVTQKMAKDKS